MEDFKNNLLAVIPKDEELYTKIAESDNQLDVINLISIHFGIDESKWPEWLFDVRQVCLDNIS